ncbi:MAG: ribose-5-phosphate isomerase A [Candidatus ainarchaeum sp.]|nr:ribose-5-phosphate isomerase A [Candidatus ainarchaeum sp.]
MLLDDTVQGLLERYVKNDSIVSFGTGSLNELFLKKLALYIEENSLDVKFVPTSYKLSALCSSLKVKTMSLNDSEIDLAFDFVDQCDEDFNYISNETTSLVRDKMIAQEASEFIIVCEEQNFVKQLKYEILLETSTFAINKTIIQAMNLGEAKLKLKNGEPMLSETGHNFIKVKVDEIYSLEDIEYQAKKIPGVLETSLFMGFADRILLHGKNIVMKSRLNNSE